MLKRLVALALLPLLALPLSGCWNYRSLDQLDIIVGIAVDFDPKAGPWTMTYEAADLANADKKGPIMGRLIHAGGETLFDAARNAKRSQADKLFFGSANVLVIGQKIAQDQGILPLIDWFLRDGECRETLCVAISLADSAGALLEKPEELKGIMSSTIHDIISEDQKATASTFNPKLFEIYNKLHSPRRSVLLPALRQKDSDGQKIPEVYGTAVLKAGKLAGFLTPDQSKYALFADDQLHSGLLTLTPRGQADPMITLEIFGNETSWRFSGDEERLTFTVETLTKVSVGESMAELDILQPGQIEQIEEAAAQKIREGILDMFKVLQKDYNADVFGLGEQIFHRNLPLWQKLEPQWDRIYPNLEIQVKSRVRIVNSGFIR